MFIITGLVHEAAPPRFRGRLQLASDEDLAEEYATEISLSSLVTRFTFIFGSSQSSWSPR